ncbi:MAG: glycoside hydrolase, partial [Treponema sp.]|nr:glycoside hydrolase [Treponema sp.]
MLAALRDLYRLRLADGRAEIEGRNGHLALGSPGPGIVSVAYVFDADIVGGEESTPHPDLVAPAASLGRGRAWDSALELPDAFELRSSTLRVLVDKATARVDVYDGEILVHGGKIGDKDTVIPQEPLRVQKSEGGGRTHGKFNFRLAPEDAFFGLGEKTGALDKRGRTFKLFNRDALGYDADRSDPLYKSVPFFIKANRRTGAQSALYFPNLMVEEVDFGVESLYYYDVRLAGGPFSYYVLTGKDYKSLLSSYCSLAGYPALPPLFSFGYIASSMAYTDPDDAERRVLGFFDRVESEGIPCEGMFFSSG